MKKSGKGIGLMFYGTGYGNGFPDVSRAKAKIDEQGRFTIYSGACEVGQGAKTSLAQIPAEILGIVTEDVIFDHEDTKTTLDAGTCAASRQTYNTGNAMKMASESLRAILEDKARELLNLSREESLIFKDHRIYAKKDPEKHTSFEEIAGHFSGENLEAEEVFQAHTTEMNEATGEGNPYWPYTFGACGVEVEVNTETGTLEILSAILVQDVGRAVNPKLIEGQMDGGFAMAQGYALLEDLNIVGGEIKHHNFTKYLIPTALDAVEVQKIIVEDPESSAPFGAKGIGEPVMIPVAPAILNAIYDAVGVRITEIPVTPERLLKAIKEAS
ncbi:xanthine dehydrogenase family protein molybdopterin-binding subunit [Isachenkonia alkalipeptolytica]|uniref:Xanthine dehydrogenase family protein molybdopterin-binding subunit n=1 Tax=Isachenkonia alkalipeptolytica TaxID=2565777 RepID=A0AA44BEL2_9CLOT|nr:molybdopterin cofactor-binding domain-containing protein [Isachenkonia alkalipeptolytica]NBG89052.1 xanthine dehydrogenase family protein molybdopterin-binding subunit [Isachenkonia alkalipeptolytica]